MIRRCDDITLADMIEWEVDVWEGMLRRHASNPEWSSQVLCDLAREKLLALCRQPPLIGGQHGLN